MKKEFIYVGHYIDEDGHYILKIGTTNNLDRRRAEHNRNYHQASRYTMPVENSFEYDWSLPLSKYNTIRFEDSNRQYWNGLGIGEFVRNDRFCCKTKPNKVTVKIRKVYEITLN